jgi:hypothetical protein
MDSENHVVAFIQQIPRKASSNLKSGGGGEASVWSEDSESGHLRTAPRTLCRDLGFVGRICRRGSWSSDPGTGSSWSLRAIGVHDSSGGIQMTTMMAARVSSPVPTQTSNGSSSNGIGRRGSFAESTAEDICCSICLCEYVVDDRVRVLPCTHEYHAECIGKTVKATSRRLQIRLTVFCAHG